MEKIWTSKNTRITWTLKEKWDEIQPGEIGCFLSHKKALKKFLLTDAEYAIVFEDDAVPEDGFMDTLNSNREIFKKQQNSSSH